VRAARFALATLLADLKQKAVVLAWFAWQAANTAERIPRP
jgi:hypothetical protein